MLREEGERRDLRVKLIRTRGGRQYLQPTSDVASLLVGDGTKNFGNRDVILQTLDGRLRRIDKTHPSYMLLQYPLLFPYGTNRWTPGIPKVAGTSNIQKNMTMREALAYRIHDRENEGDSLIDGGRLIQ